jgi:hypothetical protein
VRLPKWLVKNKLYKEGVIGVTLDEIKQCNREVLLASDIADLIHIDAQDIREVARTNPKSLGFPVIVSKRNVKIPRRAFVRFMEGQT